VRNFSLELSLKSKIAGFAWFATGRDASRAVQSHPRGRLLLGGLVRQPHSHRLRNRSRNLVRDVHVLPVQNRAAQRRGQGRERLQHLPQVSGPGEEAAEDLPHGTRRESRRLEPGRLPVRPVHLGQLSVVW
jgi:hypothetical protein